MSELTQADIDLLAIGLMGWKKHPSDSTVKPWLQVWLDEEGREVAGGDWNPETSWEACGQLLERLRAMPEVREAWVFFCDADNEWACELYSTFGDSYERAETAPQAVAAAALALVKKMEESNGTKQ